MAASSSKPSLCHDEEISHSFEELDLSFGSFTPEEILNIIRSSSSSNKKKTNAFVRMAKMQKGSVELLKRIVYEDPMQWQEILDEILECILEVITNEYGHHLFLMILERCDLHQFQTIIDTLELNEALLINASFMKYGSIAIQGFIKKLKLKGLAHSITSLLSKRFVELMTSEHGRYVVLQCIYTFGAKENEVLFSCAMHHFKEVATTKYGCSSLNDFLKLMSIVLENALALNDEEAIHKICDRLKMEFINLPRRGSGSLVQTCTRASKYGMKSVVESLLQVSENTLLELASERFGTYVIQVALILTRVN
nr:pumilio homolog 12-like [Ipomoea batatas]